VAEDGTWRLNSPTRGNPPPKEDLATFRSGISREPGTVAALFPYYRTVVSDEHAREWHLPAGLKAEHVALGLYGLHQQSQRKAMHQPGTPIGRALLRLRRNDRLSADAVDRRVSAAIASTSLDALATRLRGLITQLRGMEQPVDYDRLVDDLLDWQWPNSQQRIRRFWGADYFRWSGDKDDENAADNS
jgi:CRISPR system Cascade subunit CasB